MASCLSRVLRFVALSTLLLISLPRLQAQTETVLYNFCSQAGCVDGAKPSSTLTPDAAGNFYGTTHLGGAHGYGTVFELSPDGNGGYNENVLYSFCSMPRCADGSDPASDLIFDPAGNLYGTACSGGFYGQSVASPCADRANGFGVVFKLSPQESGACPSGTHPGNGWCQSVLHSFRSSPDGAFPFFAIASDLLGNLYGTTSSGGNGSGTAYKLSMNGKGHWSESVLYSFCSQPSCSDGASPNGLVNAGNGSFYGTTADGGASQVGTAFQLTPQPPDGCPAQSYPGKGWCETILHAFAGHPTDGAFPVGTPAFDAAGNIYGATTFGGRGSCDRNAGCGTVWKLAPVAGGPYTAQILHTFASGPANLGCCDPIRLPHYPLAGVVLDSYGNIFGTSAYGGSSSFCNGKVGSSFQGCGTLFELEWLPLKPPHYKFDLSWVFNSADGADLSTSLTLFSGNLYGTTINGGLGDFCPYPEGCGVAFNTTP